MSGRQEQDSPTVLQLDNGLQVVLEFVPHVESVAYNLLIPGGIVRDPQEYQGASIMLADLTTRGAGKLNSRELSEAFENAGIRHAEGASHNRFTYRGSLLSEQLPIALQLLSSMILEPHLPENEVESIRNSCLHDIEAAKDNPAQRALVRLCERYYPSPYNRRNDGNEEGLRRCDIGMLKEQWRSRYCAGGSVLSLAGKIDIQTTIQLVSELFGGWSGEVEQRPPFGSLPVAGAEHIESDSAQVQIVVAYPAAPFLDKSYYIARLVAGVLSGGMFGRLFIEVRENRGLCYSIYARHSASRDCGTIIAHAGTTPDRAQETLDVMLQQLRIQPGSISQEELERVRANILASMVMGEESTASRAVSNGVDYWLLQRVRSLEEIKEQILSIELKDVNGYLESFPVDPYVLQTLGPKPLEEERLS